MPPGKYSKPTANLLTPKASLDRYTLKISQNRRRDTGFTAGFTVDRFDAAG
jgi:hypothetical protein